MGWRFSLKVALARRRAVWWPTWIGWLFIAVGIAIPGVWWSLTGDSFLSLTDRLPAEVLVVEGWIGSEGVQAAAAEFERGGYEYVVASGGWAFGRWDQSPSSYPQMAERELVRSGVSKERIIVAQSKFTERRRTYESAVAVFHALQARGIQPKALNVFTLGPHARRSQLVFAKVGGSENKVGVIAWTPVDYGSEPWWRSSERAKDLISETAGYVFEALLNSGRMAYDPGRN
jgi:uncharacterized SAM-binding protein YcdF (DUF218 family)